jgi:hypothetical protein
MKLAKAPQEHINTLMYWMQFNDELMQIDPTNKREWESFKDDWMDFDKFKKIIVDVEDDENDFSWEFYASYYQQHISHIHMRIIFGYETLVNNVCDPELDYLAYNKELTELIKQNNKSEQNG